MSGDPILVFQMQRLGDILLTLPLMRKLAARFPGHPLLLAARPEFSAPLAPLLPDVAFIDPSGPLPRHCEAVINLGTHPRASMLAGSIGANLNLGSCRAGDSVHINGFWQLYRAALTFINRHNTFHWADLNQLDIPGPPPLPAQIRPAATRRVGLFLGASEPAKRPDAKFWSGLGRRLLHNGLHPVLLGGPAEKDFAQQVGRTLPVANLAGRTSLAKLAAILRTLDLLITPDTGPMHLADWLGVPVLNLSMGNVAAAETGPWAPGQQILQASLSCNGCWRCERGKLYCHRHFEPLHVGDLASAIIHGAPLPQFPALRRSESARDNQGLHSLTPAKKSPACRSLLDDFWRKAWLHFADGANPAPVAEGRAISGGYPKVAASMLGGLGRLLTEVAALLRKKTVFPAQFWQYQPWHLRFFAGHSQMCLENGDYAAATIQQILGRIDLLREILSRP